MKKFLLLIVILLFVISCSKEIDKREDHLNKSISDIKSGKKPVDMDSIAKMKIGAFFGNDLKPQEIDSLSKMSTKGSSKSINSEPYGPEYTDWSGLIHIQMFAYKTLKYNHPEAIVTVPSDYALVGGGAYTSDYTNNEGAFLVNCRPFGDSFNQWIGSSKDHIFPNPHCLTVYAMGMRIDGVTPEYLRSKIHVHQIPSSLANHPNATVNVPSNELLIGGGAWDSYSNYGNMLVKSFPLNGDSWYAEGKDHRRADPGIITVYAIGIENISYPNIGYLQVGYSAYPFRWIAAEPALKTTSVTIPSGWALTCCGGEAHYDYGFGRMISSIYPESNSKETLTARYQYYFDYGEDVAFALRIQKAK